MSSLEHALQAPVLEPSGDSSRTGDEQVRSAALVTRRSPFTGRVTYVDPRGARALRRRVPRPILASASLMALAIGMFVSTSSGPGSPTIPERPTYAPTAAAETAPAAGAPDRSSRVQ